MDFGIIPINVGEWATPEKISEVAAGAEAAGVESIWTFEHVIVPENYESKYPYHPSGKFGAQPETPFVDPLIALTYAAAHTSKLRLGTGKIGTVALASELLERGACDIVGMARALLTDPYLPIKTRAERRCVRVETGPMSICRPSGVYVARM